MHMQMFSCKHCSMSLSNMFSIMQDEETAIMQRLVWEPHAADLLHEVHIKQVDISEHNWVKHWMVNIASVEYRAFSPVCETTLLYCCAMHACTLFATVTDQYTQGMAFNILAVQHSDAVPARSGGL